MQKIPTLFERDPADMSRVTARVTPGCEWVFQGEGVPTRKWDGTNVRVTVARNVPVERGLASVLATLEKRRNPTREEKAAGAEPGYALASRSDPADKHIFAALDATAFTVWPEGLWSAEALGPKIQGGIDGDRPMLVPFSVPGWALTHALIPQPVRTFEGLATYLRDGAIEGVVFHHSDGRMAKIKARDFGVFRVAP